MTKLQKGWAVIGSAFLFFLGLVVFKESEWRLFTSEKVNGTQILNISGEISKKITLRDLHDRLVTAEFGEVGPKKIVVHFWASWCGPCADEFPALIKFSDRYKQQVIVYAISIDENPRDVLNFTRAFGQLPTNFVVLLDPENKVAPGFGTVKIPETYLFNGRNLFRKVAGSGDWNNVGLNSWIRD